MQGDCLIRAFLYLKAMSENRTSVSAVNAEVDQAVKEFFAPIDGRGLHIQDLVRWHAPLWSFTVFVDVEPSFAEREEEALNMRRADVLYQHPSIYLRHYSKALVIEQQRPDMAHAFYMYEKEVYNPSDGYGAKGIYYGQWIHDRKIKGVIGVQKGGH